MNQIAYSFNRMQSHHCKCKKYILQIDEEIKNINIVNLATPLLYLISCYLYLYVAIYIKFNIMMFAQYHISLTLTTY